MTKNGFPMPTAKNGFHILNLHPKKYVLNKYPCFNANLLEKLLMLTRHIEQVYLQVNNLRSFNSS